MKPLIGITTEEQASRDEWRPSYYAQNHHYSDAILGAGGVPVLIPFTHDLAQLRDMYERLDGILFAGGGDLHPDHYNEEAHEAMHDTSGERDRIELQLIKWAIADDKPMLAICRGFQVMNVALGGTLIQDISSQVPGAQDHELSTHKHDKTFIAHQLTLAPDSKLASLIGDTTVPANTHHHQAVKKPAPGMLVTGWAEDGIIESGEIPSRRFAIGVQCHPEALVRTVPGWQKVLSAFVAAAREGYASPARARRSSSTDASAALLEEAV